MPRPEADARETRVAAIIVAAGRSTRFGHGDKLFRELDGRPVIVHTIGHVHDAALVDEIVVVVGDHSLQHMRTIVRSNGWPKVRAVVPGGVRRQDSVAAGLAAVPGDAAVVLIHDGARPFAAPALFDAVVSAARRHGAAIAAVPVVDTLKRALDGLVLETVDREGLWAAQTPQAFAKARLSAAFAFAAVRGIEVTDEARLFELMGEPVALVTGSAGNIKITRAEDMALAESLARTAAGVGGP